LEVEEGMEEAATGRVVDEVEEGEEDGLGKGGSEGGSEDSFDEGSDTVTNDNELGVGEGDVSQGF